MRHLLFFCTFCILLTSLSQPAQSDTLYDFDYNSRNDMRGAWLLCATSGFTGGDCPKVLTKCWQPPMIYFVRKKRKIKVQTYCAQMPNFSVTVDDVDQALAEARRRAALGVPLDQWE